MRLAYPVRPYRHFYIAAGFLDQYYLQVREKNHKGIDLNLKTGGDSDLGYPVQSMVPGEVIASDTYSGWGGIVVVRAESWVRSWIAKRLGRHLQVVDIQYAHLGHITVQKGDKVGAADHLGSIGKGDREQYVAHLHLEVRCAPLRAEDPQEAGERNLAKLQTHYLDPADFISELPFSDFGSITPPRRQHFIASHLQLEGGDYALQSPRMVVTNRKEGKYFLRTEKEKMDDTET